MTLRTVKKRLPLCMIGVAVLAAGLACSDQAPTEPEVAIAPPEVSRQDVLIPAIGYETIIVGEDVGLTGFFDIVAGNGDAVIRRQSDGARLSFSGGDLLPMEDASLLFGANALGEFAGRTTSGGAATFFRGESTPLEGGDEGFAVDLNDNGIAVGTTGGLRAAIWEDGSLVETVEFDGYDAVGYSVSNSGDVLIRNARQETASEDAPLYFNVIYRDGEIIEIPNLDSRTRVQSRVGNKALSENGRAIGIYGPSGPGQRAFYFMDGVSQPVAPLPGYTSVRLFTGISASGLAVGDMSGPEDLSVAITYEGSEIEVLIDPPVSSRALGVNVSNDIVGILTRTPTSPSEPYVVVDGEVRVLPVPPGATRAFRPFIDNLGGVYVGFELADSRFVPVYYRPSPDAIEDDLVRVIDGLVEDEMLVGGVGKALLAKLTNGEYTAFTNQVRALVRSGRLPPALGAALIRAAEELMS